MLIVQGTCFSARQRQTR